jgi:hypothetical protein
LGRAVGRAYIHKTVATSALDLDLELRQCLELKCRGPPFEGRRASAGKPHTRSTAAPPSALYFPAAAQASSRSKAIPKAGRGAMLSYYEPLRLAKPEPPCDAVMHVVVAGSERTQETGSATQEARVAQTDVSPWAAGNLVGHFVFRGGEGLMSTQQGAISSTCTCRYPYQRGELGERATAPS